MSKVIKSVFVTNTEMERKTIAIKKVSSEDPFQHLDQITVEQNAEFNANIISEELQKAMNEAETIRQEAQLEYEQFLQTISDEKLLQEQQAQELYKQAEENGYNEGFQQGLQEGQRQYESFIQEAKQIVTASQNDYFQKIEEAEPMIVQLAVKVAEKIIATSLEVQSEKWLSIVKAVMDEVREQEQVKIYVHPNWYEYTLAHKEELKLLLPNCNQLSIYPDARLEEYGCEIETPFGKVDASVDSQLTEIKDALLERLKELGGNESR